MENRNFNSQSQVPLTCCQKIWTSGHIGNNGLVTSGLINSGQINPDGQVIKFALLTFSGDLLITQI